MVACVNICSESVHGQRPKNLYIRVAVPPTPFRVPSPLSRVSRQSRNDKIDNEVKWGTAQIF